MSLSVTANYNHSNVISFEEKKAIFQKLTGKSIQMPESGVMPHILSPESTIELGFFGEFFRVGFSSPDGHMAAVENLARRFAEMREELLERYSDDQDTLYKRMGKLNQAFEAALRSTTLVPIPKMPNAERSWNEYETMRKIAQYIQESLIRHMDAFFEDFLLSIQSQGFQEAFDGSMARLKSDETSSLERLSYSDAARMLDTLSTWHETTDEDGNQIGIMRRHEESFRAIVQDESISRAVRDEIAELLGIFAAAEASTSCYDPETNSVNIAPERTKLEKTFNVRGGLLVLTFCSERGLISAEIIRGGHYGKTNTELGRVQEPEIVTDEMRQILNMSPEDGHGPNINENVVRLLGRIGVDTSRSFSVNGRAFQAIK
ncbi:MAG: hypothetical protein FWB91_00925 [Defluviitaleaceae bacterium]|nr:hypothetical protein [Defluviitaleaceae bacterium]